jgi:hydrogenase 3 maturation protease
METTTISPDSWKVSLGRLLNRKITDRRIAILGIGNTLRCDDAAGILVARALMDLQALHELDSVLVIDAGHAPENRTSDLRYFQPDVVLLIDAADMGEAPGTIRWIEVDEIEGISASTHSLPLSMLSRYLNWELKCEVLLLGIQPANTDVGETVTGEVMHAVTEIVREIQSIPEMA